MSGHSKWSTIKRKKGALDVKRSKIFSRLSKEITIATKEGGSSDPEMNPRLRLAVQNAKGQNMPKDVISRAISKADSGGVALEETNFEGYGVGGIAIYVECLSDNNNRTVSNIRAIFTKGGGSLGTNGSLSFIFNRKGVFTINADGIDAEDFELSIIDYGVEDFEVDNDKIILTCPLEDFGNVQKGLEDLKIEVENAELQRIPTTTTTLDVEHSLKLLKMIESFEDNDDVQNVFHNLEMTDELLKVLEEE